MRSNVGKHKRVGSVPRHASARAERVVIGVLVFIVLCLLGVLVWAVATGKFVKAGAGAGIDTDGSNNNNSSPPSDSDSNNSDSNKTSKVGSGSDEVDIPVLVGLGVVILLVLYLIWVIYYISVLRPGRAERFFDLALQGRKNRNQQMEGASLIRGNWQDDAEEGFTLDLIKREIIPRYVVMRGRKAGKLMNKFKTELMEGGRELGVREVERLLPRTVPERAMKYFLGATGRGVHTVPGEGEGPKN